MAAIRPSRATGRPRALVRLARPGAARPTVHLRSFVRELDSASALREGGPAPLHNENL